jgi:hypothetical protein
MTSGRWDEGTPERLYVISGGRKAEGEVAFDLVTLVIARSVSEPGMQPEQAAILSLCHHPLSVAEVSAHLRLPFSVVTVLLSELARGGMVDTREPVRMAELPTTDLLEAVIRGLREL